MCLLLKLSRSLIYYKYKTKIDDRDIEDKIFKIFKESRNNYGVRKIKRELDKSKVLASRRRIGRVMRKHGLVSNYTRKQYKKHSSKVNNDKTKMS